MGLGVKSSNRSRTELFCTERENLGRKGGEERSWTRGRLCAEMQPFPVTFNIQ